MSVFSDIKPRNRASRNAFDLSRRSVFSTKAGQILPVFVQPTLPSSHYRLDMQQLLRTQPLQTAAFTGFSINYDFVFVPYNHLYSSFNQFIAQRQNKNLANQPSYQTVPVFDFSSFIKYLLPYALYDFYMAQFPFEAWLKQCPQELELVYCTLHNTTCPNYSSALEVFRTLDMLGYGNFLPLLKKTADVFNTYLVDTSHVSVHYENDYELFLEVLNNWVQVHGFVHFFTDWLSLCQQFLAASGGSYDFYIDDYLSDLKSPTLWPVLAYNKCFYEYYRNSYYDLTFDLYDEGYGLLRSYDYVQLFNYDDYTSSFSLDVFRRLVAMFSVKYHAYKRDLFTGVLPSTQFGDVSMMLSSDEFANLIVRNDGDAAGSANGVFIKPNRASLSTGQTASIALSSTADAIPSRQAKFKFDPAIAISVLESRRADAMQRFKERMMRAGDKTKDVFVAHGWTKPKSESAFEPVFLGSFDGRLDINPVAATTDSSAVNLGQLGANGVSTVNGSRIDFDCSDFGVIIGLMYIIKDAEYDAYGVERAWNLVEPFDFPYPELQNISLAPVVRGQLIALGTPNASAYVNEKYNTVLGYLPRYMEYKTAIDKVHGEFYSSSPFANQGYSDYDISNLPIVKGEFSSWVSPRQSLFGATNKDFLYQSPSCVDGVFYAASTALQSTDQFLVNAYFRCHAVEPLSVIGLPI